MILIVHILLAVSSLAYSTYGLFSPSAAKLYTSYSLIAATLGSGVYLVISTHSNMLHACVSGVLYLGVILALTITAGRILARQTDR